MNDRDFVFWLHGYFELAIRIPDLGPGDGGRIQLVRRHIELARSTRTTIDEFSLVVEHVSGLLANYYYLTDTQRETAASSVAEVVAEQFTNVTWSPNPPGGWSTDSDYSKAGLNSTGVYQSGDSIHNTPWQSGVTCSLDHRHDWGPPHDTSHPIHNTVLCSTAGIKVGF